LFFLLESSLLDDHDSRWGDSEGEGDCNCNCDCDDGDGENSCRLFVGVSTVSIVSSKVRHVDTAEILSGDEEGVGSSSISRSV